MEMWCATTSTEASAVSQCVYGEDRDTTTVIRAYACCPAIYRNEEFCIAKQRRQLYARYVQVRGRISTLITLAEPPAHVRVYCYSAVDAYARFYSAAVRWFRLARRMMWQFPVRRYDESQPMYARMAMCTS